MTTEFGRGELWLRDVHAGVQEIETGTGTGGQSGGGV